MKNVSHCVHGQACGRRQPSPTIQKRKLKPRRQSLVTDSFRSYTNLHIGDTTSGDRKIKETKINELIKKKADPKIKLTFPNNLCLQVHERRKTKYWIIVILQRHISPSVISAEAVSGYRYLHIIPRKETYAVQRGFVAVRETARCSSQIMSSLAPVA